ncbi:large conductance mechanosensitive channel protein MscL [Paenibacillus sp. TRM 82003]|nr:large conductance mechanosensitive channel protein MscL [Paenibacillus sp. TRM 82003]
MLKEFKQFALKGNVVDLAVGVIIGGAFGKIVTSLVNDIVMPPIGMLLGGVRYTDLFLVLDGSAPAMYPTLESAREAGVPTLNYGLFLNTVLDFLIVALTIFLVIRQINKIRKKFEKPEAPKEATTKTCRECLSEVPLAAKRCKYCTTPIL